MTRYYDLDDGSPPERKDPVASPPKAKHRVRGAPTRRAGKQVRTVIATGRAACGGNSLLVGFGAEDFAAFVGMTSEVPGRAAATFRRAVSRGLVDPTSLESLVAFRDRRGAVGQRCQVFANGHRVAAVTILSILPRKGRIVAAVSRVIGIGGARWQGREVDLTVSLGTQMVSFRGKLTKTTFEGA